MTSLNKLFIKYPSLTNSSQRKFIDNVRLYYPNETWIVTEKIHGANFSIIFDKDNNINFASRNMLLKSTDKFYDLPGLKFVENNGKSLVQRVSELNQYLREFYGDTVTQVNMYGEYAGTLTQGNKVQKEVDYGTQEFYLFDITVTMNGILLAVSKTFVRDLAEKFGLAQPVLLLVTNNFDEALSVPNDFDSISGRLKYNGAKQITEELIFSGQNITEGVVIEPDEPKFFSSGTRVILKNKNSKFSENHTSKPMKKEAILSDSENKLFHLVNGYINEQRVSNVCSHYGYGTKEELAKNFSSVVKEVFADVVSDLEKDEIDLTEFNRIQKLVGKNVANEVRLYLKTLD